MVTEERILVREGTEVAKLKSSLNHPDLEVGNVGVESGWRKGKYVGSSTQTGFGGRDGTERKERLGVVTTTEKSSQLRFSVMNLFKPR